MIFTTGQYNKLYDVLYDWLAIHTPGKYSNISRFKYYQDNLWNPIIETINGLLLKSQLNKKEKEFLKLVLYTGPIYRIQNYRPKRKGHIYENEYFQSWSSSLDGVAKLPTMYGEVLLLVGHAEKGLNLYGLLEFFIVNEYITPHRWKSPISLGRYVQEEEIVYPVQIKNIDKVIAVDKDNLYNWEKEGIAISKEKWKRNSLK